MSLVTQKMSFAIGTEGLLLGVNPDMPAAEALALSADLAEGVQLFAKRLHASVDDGGYVDLGELRALGFLAETASILSRSVLNTLNKQEGAA